MKMRMNEEDLRKALTDHALYVSSGGSEGALADLIGANLRCADLSDADLSGANLRCADLSDADLRGANLSDADLIGANFSCANLSDANLRRADLRRAILSDANLQGADLIFMVLGPYSVYAGPTKTSIGCECRRNEFWKGLERGDPILETMATGADCLWGLYGGIVKEAIRAVEEGTSS